ncbi:glycerate kinase [Halomonas elongata]|uniref:Glycerate kinase n=1 Tax=Halomonas elongata (strain ATCC 33173 / DSM 2581 / NBRC 15536 / NCIMB 2198 / 1H9) TaxID=768066 RepID=A0A1R4A4G4_HALED|nr:glycerate kinase [Halomonas elongata]WBF16914.1 glycerate kinase [Halomonas elongata]WPU45745.1 glycerate kinase [Halomonas elongata DSM 2581]SJK83837.1 glycerate kinase [Halomonas elongata DSM 2581]
MRILLAPDSYKDSLSASEAAAALAKGVMRAAPQAEIDECPMGDGGEGTLDALLTATLAEQRIAIVNDALGRACKARWGWDPESQTAFIELAEACGLQRLSTEERTALYSSSYGFGELIKIALDHGAKRLVLLLGGSATNDAGAGMLQALGVQLVNNEGTSLSAGGINLSDLKQIGWDKLDTRLHEVIIEAILDVDNPLVGKQGASAVFGPQKGATPEEVERLDKAFCHFADVVSDNLGHDYRDIAGVGAAGGLGFSAVAFLKAKLCPGIERVMSHVGFEDRLSNADLVITGEGRLDIQSLSGKTPIGIARQAKQVGVPAVVIAGHLGAGWEKAYEEGVTSAFSLADGPITLNDATSRCGELLTTQAESITRLFIKRK